MEDFSSTGQLITLGLVDSPIGTMAKGLALVDVEALVAKDMLLGLKYSMSHRVGNSDKVKHSILTFKTCLSLICHNVTEVSHDTMVC